MRGLNVYKCIEEGIEQFQISFNLKSFLTFTTFTARSLEKICIKELMMLIRKTTEALEALKLNYASGFSSQQLQQHFSKSYWESSTHLISCINLLVVFSDFETTHQWEKTWLWEKEKQKKNLRDVTRRVENKEYWNDQWNRNEQWNYEKKQEASQNEMKICLDFEFKKTLQHTKSSLHVYAVSEIIPTKQLILLCDDISEIYRLGIAHHIVQV